MSGGVKGPIAWRNWRSFRDSERGGAWAEYALYSDTHLTGEMELGPYVLLNTVPTVYDGSRPVLCLRVYGALAEEDLSADFSKTDSSSYHGGWIADEIAALLSLALGRRFANGGMTRNNTVGDDPLGKPWEHDHKRPYLPRLDHGQLLPRSRESVNITEASELMSAYADVAADTAVALARAAKLYQRGIWVADDDPSQTWVRLVSAIEAAANCWVHGAGSKDDAADLLKRFHPVLHSVLSKCDGSVVDDAAAKLTGILGTRKKFLDFLQEFVPDPLPDRTEFAQVDWRSIAEATDKVYHYRSRDLHDGEPFPAPMCRPPESFEDGRWVERPLGKAASASGGVWQADDLPMHLWVFEYIARGALLNWWAHASRSSGIRARDELASTNSPGLPGVSRSKSRPKS